jgi:hypothetical protein
MMKHDSDSYKIVIKAEALMREAYCLYNSNSRSEISATKVYLKSVVDDLKELTKAIEDFSTIFEGDK